MAFIPKSWQTKRQYANRRKRQFMGKKIEKTDILRFIEPQNALPVVFDSPHSGNIYPDDFGYSCNEKDLKRIEDAFVDELFSPAPEYGASLLCALFPRTYIDVNRARNDIDENLFDGAWPEEHFGSIDPSHRSDSGIGLISRIIKPGTPIYSRDLTPDEIMNRIRTYYDPYHDTLCTALNDAYYNHGQFWHINLHSMPSSSAYPKRAVSLIDSQIKPSDIVLGDLDGRTCNRDFLYGLRDFWAKQGYTVTINDPFKGVELISRYAQPTRGKNSVQIEINRSLYMNEKTGKKKTDYQSFKTDCSGMIKFCTEFAQSKLTQIAAD